MPRRPRVQTRDPEIPAKYSRREVARPRMKGHSYKEDSMTSRYLWRGFLTVALCLVLAAPARADSLKTAGDEILIGIVVVAAAVVVGTVLIIHYSKKRTITGCV